MQAFIVRPFGTRNGIDFNRVEKELLDPVLNEFHIRGRTTGELAYAGNIRTDMFERLLVADLVIADISIHNANVYYELGIRHALRDHTTILIRAKVDEVPFDLKTDRYLDYPPEDPASAIPELREAIRQSIVRRQADSPVYLLLPRLEPQDPSTFNVVPQGFTEEVRVAAEAEDRPMLAVLSEEIESFNWALSGRRVIGQAQFQLSAWPDARETWGRILSEREGDFEANLKLGTVYQRLGDLTASTIAISRVLEQDRATDEQRAEALALRASNAKQRWTAEWRQAPADARRAVAVRSAFLYEAARDYDDGYSENLNHIYSGINALALITIIGLLAEAEPQEWANRFADDVEAASELQRTKARRQVLAAAVQRSLEAARQRQQREGKAQDVWLDMTWADYRLLTATRPPFVKNAYDTARARLAKYQFSTASAARQLRMYLQLGVLTDNAMAGLEGLGASQEEAQAVPTKTRILVFSGHRVDARDRPKPRFPNERAEQARSMIRDAVEKERALAGGGSIEGVAGGASGGDILFHETCTELGIPTTLLLAMPPAAFAAKSVADGGPEWMERFRRLCERVPPRILSSSEGLPRWLEGREGYTVWQRSNLWILHNALSRENADVTLIVLWNGEGGDGPGGTADMVDIAGRRGVKVVILDALELTRDG